MIVEYILGSTVLYLKYRVRYPGAKVAFGARISGDSTIGEAVRIAANSNVMDSVLSDNVIVHANSAVTGCVLGKNAVVYGACYLNGVTLGRFSYVGDQSHLSRTRFGSFCSGGPSLLAGAGDHPHDYVSTSPVFYSTRMQCGTSFAKRDHFDELKKTTIGSDVWIGARVFIRDGVNIGHGAIVGAGSIVLHDVPDYAIVGGVPARVIRFRFPAGIVRDLLDISWWDWSEEHLLEGQSHFAQNDPSAFLEWARHSKLGRLVDMSR